MPQPLPPSKRFTTGYRVPEANADTEWFEDGEVRKVTLHGNPENPDSMCVEIQTTTASGLTVPYHALVPLPVVGDTVVIFGRPFGFHRGFAAGEVVVHWLSPDELAAKNMQMREKITRDRAEALERDRSDLQRRTEALRAPLRARVEAKRASSKLDPNDWDASYWAYELFVCEEAQALYLHFRSDRELAEYRGASNNAQRALYPGLSDQHSGNTYAVACAIASVLFANEAKATEYLCAAFGALAPLVGSDEAG